MSSKPPEGRRGIDRRGIIVAIVIIVILALFVPFMPTTYVAYELKTSTTKGLITQLSTEWTTKTYYSYTTALNTETRTFVKLENGEVIDPGRCVYGIAYIKAGSDIAVRWRSDESVDIKVYDEVEGQKWVNGMSAQPLAAKSGTEGILPLHISATGKYYFAACNPHKGILGIGAKKVALLTFTVSGTTFEEVTITQTLTTIQPITHTTITSTSKPVVYTETVTKTEYKSIFQKLVEKAK